MTYGPFERMSVVFGDITQSDCICVVNPADKSLLGGGGLNRIIHMAAGKGLLEECKTLNGCETGEAKITKGYDLKAQYIIHTVGPHYPEKDHEELLRRAYFNTMELAKENYITSIAFPAISTGKFSYPVNEATEIAVDTVRKWMLANPDYLIDVDFVCVEKRLYECYCDQIAKPVEQ
ncbi:MAG: macro domain-containing protein [Ruminococcus sp.]|nr:macro domain-containing protein [Ruminococcus sp.]